MPVCPNGPNARLAAVALIAGLLAGCAAMPPRASLAPPGAAAAARAPVAEPASSPAQGFETWVADYRASAHAAGIDEATLAAAFDPVQFLPRVLALDRAQPEFTRAVWDYLDRTVTPERVALGQEKLARYRAEADAASARYGVPAEVLIGVWGIESGFGADYGNIPAIDALATLGFDGRREDWARAQLLAALKILQSGEIDRAHMVGSWAGALGQTQFLPTVYLAYAVDADHDGRRDIWGSMADVMASTANFLAHLGWQPGQPWGCEVRLPAGFDPARADPGARQPVAAWAAEGLQSMDGTPLPDLTDAWVLLPAGARGPAFLVGVNYKAILGYNPSSSYALAVGLLAQGVAGGPGVQAAWPRDLVPLSRTQLTALQTALNAQGFESGTPDGVMGPATREALRRYQRSVGLPADGYPTLDLLHALAP